MAVDAAFIPRLRQLQGVTYLRAGTSTDAEMAEELLRQVARLRRLTAETSLESPYTDEELAEYIVETIVTDMTTRLSGQGATDTRYVTQPVTFDLNAAAARVQPPHAARGYGGRPGPHHRLGAAPAADRGSGHP